MNEFLYTTQQAATMFDVSGETIRTWAVEFERHLSPNASPGENRKRYFTESDLEVLALISELKEKRATYQDIHSALDNGQRGKLEAPPPHEIDTLALATREQLQVQVKTLQSRVDLMASEVEQARKYKDQIIELQIRLEETQAQMERATGTEAELREKIDKLHQELQQLAAKTGQEYARGFTEGFREANKGKNQDN